ncbi:AAC(3) family N-acetyltransferase [Erysipelotrichaceae bacterium 66-17]
MNEREVVPNTKEVHTFRSLVEGLKELGIEKDDIVLVHASLSRLGWIAGGQETIVQALKECAGTIIMQSQTGANSKPSCWQDPPVSFAGWGPMAESILKDHWIAAPEAV